MARWSTVWVLFLLAGCVSAIEGLWPLSPGIPSFPIYVSLDTWHAMIAFPRSVGAEGSAVTSEPQSSEPRAQSRQFEEWGYAERAWYVEGRQGSSGAVRALLWPTEGVVEVGQHDKVWAMRTPQPPAELFVFYVSEEGVRRLRRHLLATVLTDEPIEIRGNSAFYPSVRSYHLFHTCHQYAASALREAGLPISPAWTFTRSIFAMQLRHALRIAGTEK